MTVVMNLLMEEEGGNMVMRDVDDIDLAALMPEIETLFGLSDTQAAFANIFAQVLVMWNAVSGDIDTMVETLEE